MKNEIVPAQSVEIYAANRGTTLQKIVIRQDLYMVYQNQPSGRISTKC